MRTEEVLLARSPVLIETHLNATEPKFVPAESQALLSILIHSYSATIHSSGLRSQIKEAPRGGRSARVRYIFIYLVPGSSDERGIKSGRP